MNSIPTPRQQAFCPHLGTRHDPNSAINHPSPRNHCHRGKSPVAPSLQHQENYCLDEVYTQCVVYREKSVLPFPRGLMRSAGSPMQKLWLAISRRVQRLIAFLRE